MKQKEQRLPVFAERFRELQGEMSNTEFATHLGMSRQTVGFYLNGDRIPDALGLRQIAERCSVSTDWLLGLTSTATLDQIETHEIYNAALETFGVPKQIIKLLEETGEFFEAFGKCLGGRDKVSHVAEEMADVHNMLDQFAVYFNCEDEVERQKRYKLRRLEQRIEEAKADHFREVTKMMVEELQK